MGGCLVEKGEKRICQMSSQTNVCSQSRNLNSTVALCAYECIHWHIFQANSNVFCYRRVTQVIVCHLYLLTSATNYHQRLDQGMCRMIFSLFFRTLQNNETYSVYLLQVKINFRFNVFSLGWFSIFFVF